MPGTFRFLGSADPGVSDGRRIAELARRAESIGYSALVMPDHLLEQHAPIPLLATVAAATERLRIGTFVFNVDLRHPAVLAQDLASLDVLSGGRLEIGIGAGWNRSEYQALGLPYDPVGTRIDRLAEAIAVLKGCFADGPFSFAGEHYAVSGHDGQPKPVQRPHPPLLVGGGSRRVLGLAAREADIVGLAPRILLRDRSTPVVDPHSMTMAATEEKVSWVRRAAGDRFDRLELNTYPSGGPAVITNSARREAQADADRMYQATGIELTADEVLESPHFFIGTVEALVQKVIELRERLGVSSVMFHPFEPLAPVVESLAGR